MPLTAAIFALFFCSGLLNAQSIFATLTGTVSDASDATVPAAKVALRNDASGDIRRTTSNSQGFFTFSSLPTGSYTLTVEAQGFKKLSESGLVFTGADKRDVNLKMEVGSTSEQVTVTSASEDVTPVDSGEKSITLTSKDLQNYAIVGRSAAEYIKVLPGFAITGSGLTNSAGYNGEVIGINGNGEGGKQSAIGNYSANGLSNQAIDITADGAHVSDPGCNCASPVNPNVDMIQEFKVQTSNFSAENSKGPVVINSIAKSGGRDFHGEGYLSARHYSMNSNDALFKQNGAPRPENQYYFPGGNIGGPVLIPGTGFNKNRDKLFFFTGFEYYKQTLDTGLLRATVPTAGMLNGNFSPAELAKLGNITSNGAASPTIDPVMYPGGIIPASQIDKNTQALMKLYPQPNANPNATNGYNYVDSLQLSQNSYQSLSRVDYAISDNTKLYARYNLQNELQSFPVTLWWREGSVPYPTPIEAHNQSQSISVSLTHVFSPSMTNEVVFGYTYINFPNSFADKSKVDRKNVGYNYQGIYKTGVAQIPGLDTWGNDIAKLYNPGGFETGNGTLFANKHLPSVSDNLTKVLGTHTMKFGVYYEHVINDQPANNNTNGQILEFNWGGGTGNAYADMLTGLADRYNESNLNPLHNEGFGTLEFYAQDAWKVNKKLTLEYGMRFHHLGNWYDRQGIGFAVWDPTKYTDATTVKATDYVGLTWNKRDASIPLSGFSQKPLFFAPRFGLAYDVFGKGKTVIRGGFGTFRYHTAQFTTGLDNAAGVLGYTTSGPMQLSALESFQPAYTKTSVQALQRSNDQQPLTYTYSFTIQQRLPWSMVLETAYVGSQSKYGLDSNGDFTNLNALKAGTLIGVAGASNITNYDDYRPMKNYQDVNIVSSPYYSNYNGWQTTLVRQRGNKTFQLNYTYSKSLGIVGAIDKLNLNDNYGPLANDRRNIANALYSIELGSPFRQNALGKYLVNGWQVSGIVSYQSGVNLQANGDTGFAVAFDGSTTLANGDTISSNSINGTSSIAVHATLLCNPTANLKTNQFINASCFGIPTPGHNGPTIYPEMTGPAYWTSDLSLFKTVNFGEKGTRRLQFRASAFNFANHALYTFGQTNNLNLQFGPDGKPSNPNFGITTDRVGHRVIQLAVKYFF